MKTSGRALLGSCCHGWGVRWARTSSRSPALPRGRRAGPVHGVRVGAGQRSGGEVTWASTPLGSCAGPCFCPRHLLVAAGLGLFTSNSSRSRWPSLMVSLCLVARGSMCPGAHTALKGLGSQAAWLTLSSEILVCTRKRPLHSASLLCFTCETGGKD